ncbi:MAG: hypothetical protein ACHQD9_04325 [Chitinophagales bacterium]
MKNSAFFLLCACFLISLHASATDRNFVFTYESRTLQGGLRELEAYVTYKNGREDFYSAVENRLEFEIGLSQHLQTSFYLNLSAETFPVTTYTPVTDQNGEVTFTQVQDLKTNFNVGFSNEWKYQLSDPSANKIGSALYGEISLSPHEYELEGKIILDKKFNHFVTALNLVGELEWETETKNENITWELDKKAELDYGLCYSVKNHFSLGFEARNENVFDTENGWEHSALFLGPNFSYKQPDWWVAFGIQPQLTDLRTGGLDLEDHEKVDARLLFSYSF